MALSPNSGRGTTASAAAYDLPDPLDTVAWAALSRPATGRLQLLKVSGRLRWLSLQPVTVWVHCGVHYQRYRGIRPLCTAPKPGDLPSLEQPSKHFHHVPLRRSNSIGIDSYTVRVFCASPEDGLAKISGRWVVQIHVHGSRNPALRLCAANEADANAWKRELCRRAAPLAAILALPVTGTGAAGGELVPTATPSSPRADLGGAAEALSKVAGRLLDGSVATGVAGVITALKDDEAYNLAVAVGPLVGVPLAACVFGLRVVAAVCAAAGEVAGAAAQVNKFHSDLKTHLLPVLLELIRSTDNATSELIRELGELVAELEVLAGELHHALRSGRRQWLLALCATCRGEGVGDAVGTRLAWCQERANTIVLRVQLKLEHKIYAVASRTLAVVTRIEAAPVQAARKDLPKQPRSMYVDWDEDALPAVRLFKTVLETNQTSSACAAFGACGMGGVGKTASCRLVAHRVSQHPDGIARFPDGVHWVQLSKDVTEPDVVKRICALVTNVRDDNVETIDLDMAVQHLRDALATKACLVVVDDVWQNQWASCFCEAFDAGTKSALLFSTRQRRIAEQHNVRPVEVEPLSESFAIGVLLVHAEAAGHAWTEKPEGLVKQAVDLCGGLALALSVMGALVHKFGWKEAVQRVKGQQSQLLAEKPPRDFRAYDSLRACLNASYLALQVDDDSRMLSCRHFRSLSVLRSKEQLPRQALGYLWDVDASEAVADIAHKLSNHSLVNLDDENRDNELRLGLHDLVVDFVGGLAQQDPRERDDFCRRLVNGYCRHDKIQPIPESLGGTVATARQLWNLQSDGYIERAVCHLLQLGGSSRELQVLLFDMRFIAWRVVLGDGTSSVYRLDCHGAGMAVLDRVATVVESVMAIRRRHLEDRLQQAAFELAERFSCHPASTDAAEATMLAYLFLTARSYLHPPAVNLSGVRRLTLPAELRVLYLEAAATCIRSVTTPGGNTIHISATKNGSLEVWDVDSGKCLSTLEGHSDWVTCLAVVDGGGDGTGARVVSGSSDATLRVWDVNARACLHCFGGGKEWISISPRLTSSLDDTASTVAGTSADARMRLFDAADVVAVDAEGDCVRLDCQQVSQSYFPSPSRVSVTCLTAGWIMWGTFDGHVFFGRAAA